MQGAAVPHRVVVTGLGVVTPIGTTVPQFWEGCRRAQLGISPLDGFDLGDLKILIGAQIRDFDPKARLKHFQRDKIILHADRYSWFAAAAADEAIKQSGLEVPFKDAYRVACIVGSGAGGLQTMETCYRDLFIHKKRATHPLQLVRFIGSSAAAHVGIEFGIKGPTFATCSACSTATHAIELGRDFIRNGLVDVALVGASDAPHTFGMMRVWQATHLLSPDGVFPFSKKRNGFVLGEGAGILVLESLHHAKVRGAKMLAELCGIGMSSDSTDMIHPNVEGASEAMRFALEDAQIAPTDIDYVNAHGVATIIGGRGETNAIKKVFGKQAYKLAASLTKAIYGHPLGASGGIEAVACIKAMQESWMPPTLGL